ncbi:NAD(P)H-dependent flavin oxidoreductase [Hymenobacter cellulosivorans]|uniref:Propionate 3-nitronate monooxygenase n=1 Tax=Hymenobacter cellulosivorans TaxID=2932249 RepID=A0ABY4F501_9BACT|nr:nitronate monooxygenase family protein [Hymenobacter cellulosivorans]UOQ51598.1 nitronate monooxygenase family protein [Hymenobacter cellulosivorans]
MNSFCEPLGLSYPIIQAPMAGVSTPALAVAVSEAGALGSLAAAALPHPEALAQQLAALAAATNRPINVNVFCHQPCPADPAHDAQWLGYLAPFFSALDSMPPSQLQEVYPSFRTDDTLLAVLVQARPRVISFHFGLPTTAQLAALRQTGAMLLACVTSPAEAQAAEAAGVDMLVAQGVEAGGHRGTFDPAFEPNLATLDLTRQLVQHSRLPVIAAGGLMDGADLAAAMRAGAVAGQLGTAFAACPESAASPAYRAALLHRPPLSTELTAVISGRPARGLVNRFMEDIDQPGRPPVAAYSRAYQAGKALVAAAQQAGEPGFAVQWAGTGVGRSRALPAAELVRTLAAELHQALT